MGQIVNRVDHTAMTRLDGRGIVVLGAGGQGIGTACCQLLAAGGAKILCVDNLEEQARTVAEEVDGEPYVADITDRRQVEKLFAFADSHFGDSFYGVVDIVGRASLGRLEEFDDEAIDLLFSLNLRHAIYAAQIAGPMLAARGRGSIAFISSLAADLVSPGQSIYGIAKAGLNHLVRYAADEYGPHGVRTNGIGTGLILTEKLRQSGLSAEMQQVVDGIPLRRIGEPMDIAGAVFFFMSQLSAFVNGSILDVEGGTMVGSRGLPRMGRSGIKEK